jgi:integrase
VKRCQHSNQSRCQCSWVVRYRDPSGKQREESFPANAKELASGRKSQLEYSVRSGTPVFSRRDPSMSLEAFVTQWIDEHDGTPKTKANYRSVLAQHIEPALGATQLTRVSRERVRQLLLTTMPRSVGHNVIVTARTVLVGSLNEAVRQHKIPENPAAGIRLPNGASQRAEFYLASAEELETVARHLPPEWRLAVWLMRGCGLRIGEALAMRRDNVRGAELRVEEQVLATGKLGPLKHRKPGEFRDVPLPRYVAALLEGQPAASYRTTYVFPEFAEGATLQWKFRSAWTSEKFTPHDLRHTWCSVLLASGIPITDVSRWLGHRDINLTHRVYGHLVPATNARAADAVDEEYAQWKAYL